ncbi:hypothetical protein [Blautia obeum]|jgi:hypothetical protein|uniref:hypothetical protein n=1 Tax=Blautia obeum TaxID=40520 RepID=UPI00156F495C|nr:hypothetical protein [Blautia obeum]NSG20518.1 hypothetical protein [Blautia obeum]
MEESVVKRNNSTKFEIYRETKGVRELIKIIFSKKALVAIASNAITVLLMIFAQVTRNIWILFWICMYLTLERALEKVLNSISIEIRKGEKEARV